MGTGSWFIDVVWTLARSMTLARASKVGRVGLDDSFSSWSLEASRGRSRQSQAALFGDGDLRPGASNGSVSKRGNFGCLTARRQDTEDKDDAARWEGEGDGEGEGEVEEAHRPAYARSPRCSLVLAGFEAALLQAGH
ncbi:hypothetical protein O9K51_03150 [Purpureocillium lavendulum]|uniref:Uncharacterized protein n=1 Tax=Purpureocillium lavendulum TaxID=1247861 RepID=A0AB34G135_9HYPO|nr:hypothetical protein O9K51_03150 [Purpureocillium lavendulum]